MQLVHFLLLPSAYVSMHLSQLTGNVPRTSVEPLLHIDWSAILNMWFVIGCFGLTARWFHRNDRHSDAWLLRHGSSLQIWTWCALQPVCFVASGWAAWTHSVSEMCGLQTVQILLLICPSATLLLLNECIRSARANRVEVFRKLEFKEYADLKMEIWGSAMLSWFLPLFLPVVTAALCDFVQLAARAFPSQGLFSFVVCALGASIVFMLFVPHVFVWLVRAEPMDNAIRAIAEQAWRIDSECVPTILLWPTGCRVSNAAVVGLVRFHRKLLLTDGLVQRLNERELSMVVLHELAHCSRYHAWFRMIPSIVTVAILLACLSSLSGAWLSLSCLAMFVGFVASLVGVCWWTELDADRTAIQFANRSHVFLQEGYSFRPCPKDLISALQKIYGLKNLTRSGWLHPSGSRRIAAIEALIV